MMRNKSITQKLGYYLNDKTVLNKQVLLVKKSLDEVSKKLKGENSQKK